MTLSKLYELEYASWDESYLNFQFDTGGEAVAMRKGMSAEEVVYHLRDVARRIELRRDMEVAKGS